MAIVRGRHPHVRRHGRHALQRYRLRHQVVLLEWKLPELRVPSIQPNANVVVVEKAEDSTFDYWLRISTLDKGKPLRAH